MVFLLLLPCIPSEASDSSIGKAMEALRQAGLKVAGDPTRPVYHFLPPAQWMNDPCGALRYKGYYHVFYQLNPYGDRQVNSHWGHARSKDLVIWEHLPIALVPTEDEVRCNSGCVTVNGHGVPMIFYTSVRRNGPRQHFAALGDEDLIGWTRHPANPILTLDTHGGPRFGGGWSDPFIFEAGKRRFMVIGADSFGDEVAIPLYEAQNAGMSRWEYKGLLFRAPRKKIRNMEVPIFFKLDGKWILFFHPGGPTKYYVGSFDLETLRFEPEQEGNLTHNYGQNRAEGVSIDKGFCCPHIFFDDNGRCLFYGWISGFNDDRGWNGCLALPRVFSFGPDGLPRQQPVPELRKLRGKYFKIRNVNLSDAGYVPDNIGGDSLEIAVEFEPGGAKDFGIKVCRSDDGKNAVVINYDGKEIEAAGVKIPFALAQDKKILKLHIFLDKSVMEIFVNDGREAMSKVIYPGEEDIGIELFAQGGAVVVKSLEVWKVKSIWPETEHVSKKKSH
jgi:beta-fructofuranosidase